MTKMDPEAIKLADAFENSKNASDFLDLIIAKVATAVDNLEEADSEEDNRKFSRKLKGYQFLKDLVESRKKMETTASFSIEKTASNVLRYFLKKLVGSLEELGYSEDEQTDVLQLLQNRISNWEEIKNELEQKDAA